MSDHHGPIIELHRISKRFPGVQALDDISLKIYPGEVHAVVGENGAGKSTLMNILAGELQPDAGHIVFRGEKRAIPNPFVSQQMGISVVYQELALCPNLSIAENVSLSRVAAARGLSFLNRREFNTRAREALASLGLEKVNLGQPVGQLTVAQQQLVEIAKAISGQARLLILDEPNSALTQDETTHLFTVLRRLRATGVGIVYVSHRLEEVLSLADRITVLRDGKLIETMPAAGATIDGLITRMVGREIDSLYHRTTAASMRPELVFEVKNLSSGAALQAVSFGIHAGEIVGVAGLPDAGKDELVACCFGLRPHIGEILVKGRPIALRSPGVAIANGLAFVPADRRTSGALLVMSVQDNVSASNLEAVSTAGFLNRAAMRAVGQEYVDKLDVRIASLGQQMATLSCGNEQKVIVGRGMATRPSVLILHEPTRGIDVGAKAEIYGILQDLAREGVGLLVVSSELPELIGQCDRILVLYAGRITGEFTRAGASEEAILACAMGQATHL